MDFGISVAPGADSWKLAKRAEELGYTHAWFYDTQMQNAELFVVMAATAMQTSKIRIGAGVLIPSNRLAPVTAAALATLNKLAPGRIDCGVATGFTGRRTMGVGAMKMMDMVNYVRVVQGLLDREMVEFELEGAKRKIRFLNPELDLTNLDDPITFHISAAGPRGRKLTAELGANWIVPARDNKTAIGQLQDMHKAWAAQGRNLEDLYTTIQAGGCVLADGEPFDSPRAIAQAGPVALLPLHDLCEADKYGSIGAGVPPFLEPILAKYKKEVYERYEPEDARYISLHAGHLMVVRPEERPFVTAELIQKLSFTGTKEALRDRVRELKDAGYKQISLHIRYGQPQMLEEWAEIAAMV